MQTEIYAPSRVLARGRKEGLARLFVYTLSILSTAVVADHRCNYAKTKGNVGERYDEQKG
jgi:hypothetical protein